nr:hypothetical protein [uncultured Anaerotignum sp.]
MNVKLQKALESIELFKKETQLLFELDPETPATKEDLAALAKQAYYTFDDIGKALKELSK